MLLGSGGTELGLGQTVCRDLLVSQLQFSLLDFVLHVGFLLLEGKMTTDRHRLKIFLV